MTEDVDARARVERYIAEYEDAPNWGGPTIYPKAPSIADLREILNAQPTQTILRAGRFEEWSTKDLAAQCRMQARDQLDPDFSAFMAAVGERLTKSSPPAQDEGDSA